eukprot:7062720-Pyramimonas_sp.AAC.1
MAVVYCREAAGVGRDGMGNGIREGGDAEPMNDQDGNKHECGGIITSVYTPDAVLFKASICTTNSTMPYSITTYTIRDDHIRGVSLA